jgi:hypothetical protein
MKPQSRAAAPSFCQSPFRCLPTVTSTDCRVNPCTLCSLIHCIAPPPPPQLVYTTHGEMNAEKNNIIFHPTSFGATHEDLVYRVGPGKLLDTTR